MEIKPNFNNIWFDREPNLYILSNNIKDLRIAKNEQANMSVTNAEQLKRKASFT